MHIAAAVNSKQRLIPAVTGLRDAIAAKAADVSNYIVKPFNAETLKDKIEKVLTHA